MHNYLVIISVILFSCTTTVFSADPNEILVPFDKILAAKIKPKPVNSIVAEFGSRQEKITDRIFSLYYLANCSDDIYISSGNFYVHSDGTYSSEALNKVLAGIEEDLPTIEKIQNMLSWIDKKDLKNQKICSQLRELYQQLDTYSLRFSESLADASHDQLVKSIQKINKECSSIKKINIEAVRRDVKDKIINYQKNKYSYEDNKNDGAKEQLLLSVKKLEKLYLIVNNDEFTKSLLEKALQKSDYPFASKYPNIITNNIVLKLASNALLRSPRFKGFMDNSGFITQSDSISNSFEQLQAIYEIEYMTSAGLVKKGDLKIILRNMKTSWKCSSVMLNSENIICFE